MAIVELEQVTKYYPRHPGNRVMFGRDGVLKLLSRAREVATAPALENVTLSMNLGECIGLEGGCGAGKTTLLRLIAGITSPSSGKVTVLGRVASVIEPGTAFHPRLSGGENIKLLSRFYGLKRRESIDLPRIVSEFADLGASLNSPVGSWPAALRLRAAFASAVHVGADIFLFDDVLSAVDSEFQLKCLATIRTLREQGKTFVVVIDPGFPGLAELCDRVLSLESGQLTGPIQGLEEVVLISEASPPEATVEEPDVPAIETVEEVELEEPAVELAEGGAEPNRTQMDSVEPLNDSDLDRKE